MVKTVGKMKMSGMGIASFVLALVGIAALIGVGIAGMFIVQKLGNDPELIAKNIQLYLKPMIPVMIFSMVAMLSPIIGLILGIIALFEKDRRKGLAIAGVVLNGVFLAFYVGSMIVGMMQGY